MGREMQLPLGRIFEKKRPERTIPIEKYLQVKPIRNPYLEWTKTNDAKVEIRITFKKTGRLPKILPSPDKKRIILDDPGSFVWERCDGKHAVKDIIEEFRKEYRVLPMEAQISILNFLRNLAKRKFVTALIKEEEEKSRKGG